MVAKGLRSWEERKPYWASHSITLIFKDSAQFYK
uniref:Uncharacterized protein n=1 Tax=Lepeophtheirus salmonis TaxID=72036 RepID=A0A0K2VBW3_LEPSM